MKSISNKPLPRTIAMPIPTTVIMTEKVALSREPVHEVDLGVPDPLLHFDLLHPAAAASQTSNIVLATNIVAQMLKSGLRRT